jgi:hypothetical protein
MRVGRLILVVSTLVTILVFPLLLKDAIQALRLPSAYAAPSIFDPGGRVYQNGNNDDDDGDDGDDNNDESDNEGEDNDNDTVECYINLNDNEPVPCDFEDNDNDYVPPPAEDPGPPAPAPMPAPPSGGGFQPASVRCFGGGELGDVSLILEGGTVTIRVVNAGFPGNTWLSLDDIEDLSGIPGPPPGTTMLDRMIWSMDAGSGCDGPSVNPLPAAVNLGIPYHVAADKSKLQIVILRGTVWEEVPTVPDPDPAKPYISATVQETGIYAVIQKP